MRDHTTPPDFITYCEREAEAERLWQRVEESYRHQEIPDPHHTKGEQSCCKESSEESK